MLQEKVTYVLYMYEMRIPSLKKNHWYRFPENFQKKKTCKIDSVMPVDLCRLVYKQLS